MGEGLTLSSDLLGGWDYVYNLGSAQIAVEFLYHPRYQSSRCGTPVRGCVLYECYLTVGITLTIRVFLRLP